MEACDAPHHRVLDPFNDKKKKNVKNSFDLVLIFNNEDIKQTFATFFA